MPGFICRQWNPSGAGGTSNCGRVSKRGARRAGSKRNGRNEEIEEPMPHIGSPEVQGIQEFKGQISAKFFQQPAFVNPGLRASQRKSQVRYSVFSEGTRTDGSDFTPADWGTELLLLQDIPWSQLFWVCLLGRPLDFIPTSHIPTKNTCRRGCIFCQRFSSSTSANAEEPTWPRRWNLSWATVGRSKWATSRGGWRRRCKPRTIAVN